jgi:acyl carrier protein
VDGRNNIYENNIMSVGTITDFQDGKNDVISGPEFDKLVETGTSGEKYMKFKLEMPAGGNGPVMVTSIVDQKNADLVNLVLREQNLAAIAIANAAVTATSTNVGLPGPPGPPGSAPPPNPTAIINDAANKIKDVVSIYNNISNLVLTANPSEADVKDRIKDIVGYLLFMIRNSINDTTINQFITDLDADSLDYIRTELSIDLNTTDLSNSVTEYKKINNYTSTTTITDINAAVQNIKTKPTPIITGGRRKFISRNSKKSLRQRGGISKSVRKLSRHGSVKKQRQLRRTRKNLRYTTMLQ